jgi:2-C-methyl-D-erythritol 4-phosphate cytidylyltransferase
MPSRATLRRFQTPQGFRLGTIRKAYELATADPGFAATDDCGVVHRYLPDVPIPVVAGSERNLKVTHPLDIAIAEHLCGG